MGDLPEPQAGDLQRQRLERLAARRHQPVAAPGPQKPSRRRHPARRARLGALVASCATTGGLAYLFAGSSTQASTVIPGIVAPIDATATSVWTTTAASTTTTTAQATVTTQPVTTQPATTQQTTTEPATTAATSGSTLVAFDGDTIQTRYGPLQVQAQVQDGTLVAVAVVQYPDGEGKSVRINQRALPALQSEALASQSADVDTVSGATYTSNAYEQSLQSAIDDAVAAGAMVV